MKKKVRVFLCVFMVVLCISAVAEPETIDLKTMTIEELEDLSRRISVEKQKATEITSNITKQLERDFMTTVEALMPKGTSFSYPFFGLSIVHRRNYYCVCGTVGCKLPDKTKKDLWDATIIYFYDETENAFHHAAFYTNTDLYSYDENALQQVALNMEKVAIDNLRKHEIIISGASVKIGNVVLAQNTKKESTPKPTSKPRETTVPKTATPKPTARPRRTTAPKTATPMPKITKAPTPLQSSTPKVEVTEDVTSEPETKTESGGDSTKKEGFVFTTSIPSPIESQSDTKEVTPVPQLEINEKNITLLVGQSKRLTAQIKNFENLMQLKFVWSTSDKRIATCQNGKIDALSGGNVTIICSATLPDGTTISDECLVQVNVPVTSITTKNETIKLDGGKSFVPEFTIKPKNATVKELAFASSDESIATVDKTGRITGTGAGNAKITVTATDGSGKKLVISVKVVDNRISLETAKRVALTVIVNDRAEDIFTSNGYSIDKKKLHSYKDFDREYIITQLGRWSSPDGNNTWHVDGIIIENRLYGGYYKYTMDITFDGKNYRAKNVFWFSAVKMRDLDGKDPSKSSGKNVVSEDNIYLTVSLSQVSD